MKISTPQRRALRRIARSEGRGRQGLRMDRVTDAGQRRTALVRTIKSLAQSGLVATRERFGLVHYFLTESGRQVAGL